MAPVWNITTHSTVSAGGLPSRDLSVLMVREKPIVGQLGINKQFHIINQLRKRDVVYYFPAFLKLPLIHSHYLHSIVTF